MSVYYNENDPVAAAWLFELMKNGEIPNGEIDTRSIRDVRASDIRDFTQCHFFAGIGVWARAMRDAGISESQSVWTGSCPCQPFSASGKGEGVNDERHLWPDWFWLFRQCRPNAILGEQVGQKSGYAWLDLVSNDLEGESYAVGASDTPSCGYGAPNIRNRLYFVGLANTDNAKRWTDGTRGNHSDGKDARRKEGASDAEQRGNDGRMENTKLSKTERQQQYSRENLQDKITRRSSRTGVANKLGEDGEYTRLLHKNTKKASGYITRPGAVNGFWRDADWIFCRDNKWRPVEPSSQPLANGITHRVGLLRGAGNALNLQQAKAFCEIVKDILPQ